MLTIKTTLAMVVQGGTVVETSGDAMVVAASAGPQQVAAHRYGAIIYAVYFRRVFAGDATTRQPLRSEISGLMRTTLPIGF